MLQRVFGVGLVALGLSALGGCKSQAEKCMETTEETYKRTVAACTDDACKAEAAKTKADFMEACKNAK